MAEAATFDEFVTTRSRHLLRVAYLLTGDHALAEDLLQTTLVKSWSAWRRIEGDPEPYVLRVLANTFKSWWRRRWTGERPTETLPEQAGPVPQADVDERDRVWRALSRLPRQQRLVLVLRYFEDLSEADIARTLDISAGSVKTHASKGLAKLRLDPSLRALPLPADDEAPAGNERLVAVRGRIAHARRRRTIATVAAACLAAIALVAAYALLPQLRAKALPEPAFPVQLPAFAQSRQSMSALDTDYYRLGPSAQHGFAARLDRALVWTVSERPEALFVSCLPEPVNVIVIAWVNGREASAYSCLGEPVALRGYQARLDRTRLGLAPGEPAEVSLEIRANGPLPVGTVAVAIGELIPFEAFPLVFPSAQPAPLNRALKSVDPARVTRIDAGGPHQVTVVWRGPLILKARSQSPGRLRLSVDGVPIHTLDFGTLPITVHDNDGNVVPPWGAASVSGSLQAGPNRISGGRWDPVPGSLVTISVEAERMTGDWFVALYPPKE